MRLLAAAVLSTFSIALSANASELTQKCSGLVSNLAEVFANPIGFSGAKFCGYAYVYDYARGVMVLFPRPVRNDAEMAKFPVQLLAGEHSQHLWQVPGLKSGDRVLISGELDPDKSCWLGDTCVPLDHPIFMNNLRVLAVHHQP